MWPNGVIQSCCQSCCPVRSPDVRPRQRPSTGRPGRRWPGGAQSGTGAARRRRDRRRGRPRVADDALARGRVGGQADVPLPPRGQQGRDPGRDRRPRLQPDRVALTRRRLAPGDAPAGDLGARGARTPPVGDRAAGVAGHPRPRDAATPQRDDRHPAPRRLHGGDDRPRLRPARQLRVRVRRPRGRAALPRPRHRRRSHRKHRPAALRRRLPVPAGDGDRPRPPTRQRLRRRVRVRPRRDPRRPRQVDSRGRAPGGAGAQTPSA